MNPIKINFWLCWVALFFATFSYRFILGTESPEEEPLNIFLTIISFVLILSSLACRILVLPKAEEPFVIFIIGIALAEAVALIGIFRMPYYKDFFMTLSLASIFAFLPYFIKVPEKD